MEELLRRHWYVLLLASWCVTFAVIRFAQAFQCYKRVNRYALRIAFLTTIAFVVLFVLEWFVICWLVNLVLEPGLIFFVAAWMAFLCVDGCFVLPLLGVVERKLTDRIISDWIALKMSMIISFTDRGIPQSEVLSWASELLRRGEVVAFPTETVYGLGANALDPNAVKKIYDAKGRPSQNPLIVHVASIEAMLPLVREVSPLSQKLAERFWPGPLTLIFPKSDLVPDIVTGGGDTVAIRIPSHTYARALLRECGLPLAAPSANRSNSLSPTTAQHVADSLGDRIPLILDGGPTQEGIESTVVDASGPIPKVLRYGALSIAEIESCVGVIDRPSATTSSTLPSPGMLAKHYSPVTKLECVEGDSRELVQKYQEQGLRIGVLIFQKESQTGATNLGDDPQKAAKNLYGILHQLDREGSDRIIVELPPNRDEWLAVRDRLLRASA